MFRSVLPTAPDFLHVMAEMTVERVIGDVNDTNMMQRLEAGRKVRFKP